MTFRSATRSTPTVTRLAALLLATSWLAAATVPASADMPGWAKQCAATTRNPWITSGYCEAHATWDKYYCACAYVPPFNGIDFGHRRHSDLDADNFPDETLHR